MAQEIVINSLLDVSQSNYWCLHLSSALKELVNPTVEQTIFQAIEKHSKEPFKLAFIAPPRLTGETPYEIKTKQRAVDQQAVISRIKTSETVQKLCRAFNVSLVEKSVRKVDDGKR